MRRHNFTTIYKLLTYNHTLLNLTQRVHTYCIVEVLTLQSFTHPAAGDLDNPFSAQVVISFTSSEVVIAELFDVRGNKWVVSMNSNVSNGCTE